MARIGIIYGSSTGNTEAVAKQIHEAFDGAEAPQSIADVSAEDLGAYDHLILGTSTWGIGDLQDDWDEGLSKLEAADLSGKKVAVFGTGDQEGYPDSFVDGIGTLAQTAKAKGAEIVGQVSTDGYQYDESKAVEGDQFLGLPIDEDNQSDMTADRVSTWVAGLKSSLT